MTGLFLGVDGGQSSTTALIGDAEGRVIGWGRGGPCNHVQASEGRAKFLGAVGGCVTEAGRAAGLDPATVRFEAACLGFSGGPADKESLVGELVRSARTFVTHDALIALSGGTAGQPGVAVIAGTGSMVFGRNAQGTTARAGGWGYVFGDEGGAFDLTRQALRAALRMEEGWGPSTHLRGMLLAATGAPDANDLLHRFYTVEYPRPAIAALATLVDDAAQGGDSVAQELLHRAGQELATQAAAVRRQLFREDESVVVAYIGGVFRSTAVRERFELLVSLQGDRAIAPVHGPAAGALIEAYRLAGLSIVPTRVPESEK